MKTIIYVLLLAVTVSSFAQDKILFREVRGTVADLDISQPIPQALIYLYNKADTLKTATDVEGKYRFEKVKAGEWYTLKCTYIGFNSYVKDIYVLTAKENVYDVDLTFGATTLEEVAVTAQSENRTDPINDNTLAGVRSFNPLQTDKFAGTFADPARMAANFAGVIVPPSTDFRNDVIIRGHSPLFISWRLDGFEIPNPNHFGTVGTTGGAVTLLNNNLLSKSDFYTGGMPAELPNTLIGGFDLQMKKGNSEKHEFLGQLGFNGLELNGEGYISKEKKSSYLFGIRYSFLDVMKKLGFFDKSYSAPEYKDLTLKLFFPNKKGNLLIDGIIGDSSINLNQLELSPDIYMYQTSFRAESKFLGMRYTHFITPNSSLAVQASYNEPKSKSVRDSLYTTEKYLNHFTGIGKLSKTSLGVKFKSRKKKTLISLGAKYFNNQFLSDEKVLYGQSSSPINTTYRALSDSEKTYGLFKSYVEFTFKPNEKWVIYTGHSSQYFLHNEKTAFDPRLSVYYKFGGKNKLGFSTGIFSQLPPFNYYSFYDIKVNGKVPINDHLGFLKSRHYLLSFEHNFTADLRFKIEGYFQDQYDIPVSKDPEFKSSYSMSNAGDDFVIGNVPQLVNEGVGKNYGVELTFEQLFNQKFYYLFTGSIFKAKYKAYDGTERNSTFDSGYTVNALGGYEIKTAQNHKLGFDIRLNMSGGTPYIPIDKTKAIAQQNLEVFDYSKAYEQRRDATFRADFKATYFIQMEKISLSWGIDITNLTNRKNVVLTYYDYVNKELKNIYSVGIFPVGIFKINF